MILLFNKYCHSNNPLLGFCCVSISMMIDGGVDTIRYGERTGRLVLTVNGRQMCAAIIQQRRSSNNSIDVGGGDVRGEEPVERSVGTE
jgi:hypothetical protein